MDRRRRFGDERAGGRRKENGEVATDDTVGSEVGRQTDSQTDRGGTNKAVVDRTSLFRSVYNWFCGMLIRHPQ